MKIYGISDLHLSFSSDKPMDVFGPEWKNHHIKIRENWIKTIKPQDIVILPGDISWGLKQKEIQQDFRWIHELPGTKLFFKGNHDLWWTTPAKLNAMYDDMIFLQNNYYQAGEFAVCGTRGWSLPESSAEWTDHDQKIYLRETGRLRMSLESAKQAGFQRIIAAMHYPPAEKRNQKTAFSEILEEYGVEIVIYGHLHGNCAHNSALQGIFGGIRYRLVSCDYLDFMPVCLADAETGARDDALGAECETGYCGEAE